MVKINTIDPSDKGEEDFNQTDKTKRKVIKFYPKRNGFGHQYVIDMPYNKMLNEQLKAYPGFDFDYKGIKRWCCGEDLIPILKRDLEERGYYIEIEKRVLGTKKEFEHQPLEGLKEFQKQGIDFLRNTSVGAILCYDMGLGKTCTSISFCRCINAKRVLVSTTASMLEEWKGEILKWWSEKKEEEIFVITSKKEALEYLEKRCDGVVLVSYGSIKYFKSLVSHWDKIILDEVQKVQDPNSVQSKAVYTIRLGNPTAQVIALSATPIKKEIKSLYMVLEIIRPGMFGGKWYHFNKYCKRYCQERPDKYAKSGVAYFGLNEFTQAELRERVEWFTHRVEKSEVNHEFPPYNPIKILLKRQKMGEDVRKILESEDKIAQAIKSCGSLKVSSVVELVLDYLEKGNRVCVLNYHKEIGNEIEKTLKDQLRKLPKYDNRRHKNVLRIDGEVSVKNRRKIIEDAKARDSVLIASIGCITEGLNSLIYWDKSIYGEIWWDTTKMLQVMGRFGNRLNCINPSDAIFPILQGSVDEIIMSTLKRRLDEGGKIFESGEYENEFKAKVGGLDKEDQLEALRQAFDSFIDLDDDEE